VEFRVLRGIFKREGSDGNGTFLMGQQYSGGGVDTESVAAWT
jgi:hypothetical protein